MTFKTDKNKMDIKEYDKLSLKQKLVSVMTLYGFEVYEESADDCFIAIIQHMADKRLRDIRVKNLKEKNDRLWYIVEQFEAEIEKERTFSNED